MLILTQMKRESQKFWDLLLLAFELRISYWADEFFQKWFIFPQIKPHSEVDATVQRILPEYVVAAVTSHAYPVAYIVTKEVEIFGVFKVFTKHLFYNIMMHCLFLLRIIISYLRACCTHIYTLANYLISYLMISLFTFSTWTISEMLTRGSLLDRSSKQLCIGKKDVI